MNKSYEFGYQSKKQKFILWSCKLLVAVLLGFAVYTLGWSEQTSVDKLSAAGGVFVWFWIYSNLCRVKVEVQEIFVPPFDNMHMFEAMIVGGILGAIDIGMTVYDIGRLNGWWL